MKIGYACTPLGVQFKTTRRFMLKNYSNQLVSKTIEANLLDLLKILEYNNNNNISLFRISSDIIPFGSHPVNDYDWKHAFSHLLSTISNFINKNSLRVSMHPGQYTVLNSPNLETLKKSILDLQYHCEFLDSLMLDKTHKIILHVGGVYGDKSSSIDRFISNYNSLDNSIKDRLIIENDEKSYSINDLLHISDKCSIPIVFDNLHYFCFENSSPNISAILKTIRGTWEKSDGIPKVHYSEQHPFKKQGSHSQTITASNFLKYLNEVINSETNIDIMTEVKDKDFSAIKILNCLKELNCLLDHNTLEKELSRYEFFLKEKSYDYFLKAQDIIFTNGIIKFYNYIDEVYYCDCNKDSYISTLNLVYENLRYLFNDYENRHYNKLYNSKSYESCKNYLNKIVNKYNLESMISNYYFHSK